MALDEARPPTPIRDRLARCVALNCRLAMMGGTLIQIGSSVDSDIGVWQLHSMCGAPSRSDFASLPIPVASLVCRMRCAHMRRLWFGSRDGGGGWFSRLLTGEQVHSDG